jgi:cysteine synthase A
MKMAEDLAEMKNGFLAKQFSNPANPEIHYQTTAQEIWDELSGKVDIFVAGVGTGGTVSGVGRYLKEKNKDIQIVALEPENSAVISTGKAGQHAIQGIGAGFVPENLDMSIVDEVITISDDEAMENSRMLAKKYGLLVGISSGANFAGAEKISKRVQNRNIVTIFPDTGERYISTKLFNGRR